MRRLPEWLRRSLPVGSTYETHETLREFRVHTVCESALCPNRAECFSAWTATFMILGDVCTRRCGFCAISVGRPNRVEEDEPLRVAQAAQKLGLHHVVVTSVARDDLHDEGASVFYETILAIRDLIPEATVEILTPDFHARRELIEFICDAQPNVFNHNLETVERLSPHVRPQARYHRSLDVLRQIKDYDAEIATKSGLMLGLGETLEEVKTALLDLRSVGVDIITIGQYLKSKEGKFEVEAFIHPDVFTDLEEEGKRMGFSEVYCGPYVRSSYHAGEAYAKYQALGT
ncbi:MAG: lipoyl synthase [Omnitrophica bacterium RIFCSPLOWO2_12_FULL_50_11]|nr:MAG: lipoyl synthase [Omnitrophica bacterium RIFCSPLOWO2_12_FULL_50_11]